jgi:NAD(P)-dependent dehydrogenase (short-subunit alcohol dehydrogenase family)
MASVLMRGGSKGIDLEAALAFGGAGHQVPPTMRNPSRSPELARRVAEEKLPITVTTMDVDSDESVRDNIAVIQKQHGPIDVLVAVSSLSRGSP